MFAAKERVHWVAMHGVVRSLAALSARRGDPQARLVADPAVRADPFPFYDELRTRGPLVRARVSWLTVDYAVAHELLRSEDFRVISMGGSLPPALQWLERRTRADVLHPLMPPSLLAVEPPEHTRSRKTVSSVFTTRAVAALRDGVEGTATALLQRLSDQTGPGAVVPRGAARTKSIISTAARVRRTALSRSRPSLAAWISSGRFARPR